MKSDSSKRYGSKNDPHASHGEPGADQHLGHDSQRNAAEPGQHPAGHQGHNWMVVACCVSMLIIVIALVASGTVGAGTLLWAAP